VDPQHREEALRIGAKLHANEKGLFENFLFENLNVFVWAPTNMPGIDPAIDSPST